LKQTRRQALNIGVVAVLTFIIVAVWTVYTKNVAEDYLLPVIGGGIGEFIRLLLNEDTGRQLFQGAAGLVTPIWERILGIMAIICIVLVLPFGLLELLRSSPFKDQNRSRGVQILKASALQAWQRYKNNAVVVMFAGLVLLYPI